MLRTVHGSLVAVIVTVLCSGVCGLRINYEDATAVTDKLPDNNLDFESLQLVEPLIANENEVEVVPEDYIDAILKSFKEKQKNEDFQKASILREADNVVKQRVTRQATHHYTPLYPQLPSGPPYNPYQPQPNSQSPYQPQPNSNPYAPNANQPYNPYTQNPNQPQPAYNPYTQNPNQPQPSYNPYTPNPNQQQPGYNPYTPKPNQQQPGYNPYTQNSSQPGYNPYTQNSTQPGYNPYTQNSTQPTYRPPGQNQFPQRPPQWNTNSYNSSQPGNPSYNPNQGAYNPYSGQNPYSSRPVVPSYNSSSPGSPYRPPNGQYPVYNQTYNFPPNSGGYRPPNASSFNTPLAPYNPTPGQSPNNNYNPSSGNIHPVQQFNSSSQRPPYYNPSQYPAYNNSLPNTNYPGARPAQGSTPYYPGPDGKFPGNAYNPSIPNYPPQNNNQGQNNFFYPQNNSSASYDPHRVPSQNFSYH